jgi:hypothetical protein
MAAIVDTLMVLPCAALLALFAFFALGIPFHAFLTFDGTLSTFQGVLSWWTLGFLPALAYALIVRADPV